MTTLTLVGDTAPAAPTMQTLPPLRRRVYLAAVCALRVLQTGRTWQHDHLDGYREGRRAGIQAGLDLAFDTPSADVLPTPAAATHQSPHLELIAGGTS